MWKCNFSFELKMLISFTTYMWFILFSSITTNPSPPVAKKWLVIIRYERNVSNGSYFESAQSKQRTSMETTRSPIGWVALNTTFIPDTCSKCTWFRFAFNARFALYSNISNICWPVKSKASTVLPNGSTVLISPYVIAKQF